jgi:hypothetical protein
MWVNAVEAHTSRRFIPQAESETQVDLPSGTLLKVHGRLDHVSTRLVKCLNCQIFPVELTTQLCPIKNKRFLSVENQWM